MSTALARVEPYGRRHAEALFLQIRLHLEVGINRAEQPQSKMGMLGVPERTPTPFRRGLVTMADMGTSASASQARVHQLLQTTTSGMLVPSAPAWAGGPPSAGPGSAVTLATTAALMRECSGWLERLDRGELVAAKLCEPTEPHTEYVPVECQGAPGAAAAGTQSGRLVAGSDAQREG
jgi:hypothetical protein